MNFFKRRSGASQAESEELDGNFIVPSPSNNIQRATAQSQAVVIPATTEPQAKIFRTSSKNPEISPRSTLRSPSEFPRSASTKARDAREESAKKTFEAFMAQEEARKKQAAKRRRASSIVTDAKIARLKERVRAGGNRQCWARACWEEELVPEAHSHPLETLDPNRLKIMSGLYDTPRSSAWKTIKRMLESVEMLLMKSMKALDIYSPIYQNILGFFGSGIAAYVSLINQLLMLSCLIFIIIFGLVVYPCMLNEEAYRKVLVNTTKMDEELIFESFFLNRTYIMNGTNREQAMYLFFNQPPSLGKMRNNNGTDVLGLLVDLLRGTGWVEASWLYLGQYYDRIDLLIRARYNSLRNDTVTNINITKLLNTSGYDLERGYPYHVPLSYLVVTLATMVISVLILVTSSTSTLKETLKGRHSTTAPFCERVFCKWSHDMQIQEGVANQLRNQKNQCQILLEHVSREETDAYDKHEFWQVMRFRFYVWSGIIFLLAIFGYSLYMSFDVLIPSYLPGLQERLAKNPDDRNAETLALLVSFTPSIIMAVFNFLVPFVCVMVAPREKYHKATETRINLLRTFVVRFSSIFFLLISMLQELVPEKTHTPNNGVINETVIFTPKNLTTMPCFETYVGQQIFKVLSLDIIIYLATFLLLNLPMKLAYYKTKKRWLRQEFDLPGSILAAIYVISLYWLGSFYAPLLPAMAVVHFLIYALVGQLSLYVVYEAPTHAQHESNEVFFTWVAISAFFMSLGIISFAMMKVRPSMYCGPMAFTPEYVTMYEYMIGTMKVYAGKASWMFKYITSPVMMLPLTIVFAVYLFYQVSAAHSKALAVLHLKDKITLTTGQKKFLERKMRQKQKGL